MQWSLLWSLRANHQNATGQAGRTCSSCARTAFELELSCCFPATEAGNNNKIDAAERHSAAWIGCNAAKSVWRDLVQLIVWSLAVRFGSFFCFFRLLSAGASTFLLVLDAMPSLRTELNGCLQPSLTLNQPSIPFRLLSLLLCSALALLGLFSRVPPIKSSPVLRPCAAPDSIRSPQSQAISYQFAGPHGSPRGAIE